ncbi:redoxin domain-containing protein [Chitinophaga sp. YIM B06452]|uniref:TlpA family protein disulfide reductase n=1 Tax=Chitinophaga sp. YIM B06452 TaxID=3082158 RepID=UPI0031FE8D82
MKFIAIIINISLWIPVFAANAQYQEPVLETGQIMPDIPLKLAEGNRIVHRKLSDFKGKKVVFDYWDKTCSSCIAGFPKVDQLRQKYQEELVIIAITDDSFSDFKKLREKYRNINTSKLIFAVEDSMLKRLLPLPAVPYYIWVDPERKLDAAVPPSHFNDSTIASYINGNFWSYNMSKDLEFLKSTKRFFIDKKPAKSIGDFKYNSRLKKSNPDMLGKTNRRMILDGNKVIGAEMWNRPLIAFYLLAYGTQGISSGTDIVSSDPTLMYIMEPCVAYQHGFDTWELETTYDYLIFSDSLANIINDLKLRKALQMDLEEKLSIVAEMKDTILQSLELIIISDKLPFKIYKDIDDDESIVEMNDLNFRMKNGNGRSLTDGLNEIINNGKKCHCTPIVDKTNVGGRFDLEVTFEGRSIEAINQSLTKFGLGLKWSQISKKVLVLSRKDIGKL